MIGAACGTSTHQRCQLTWTHTGRYKKRGVGRLIGVGAASCGREEGGHALACLSWLTDYSLLTHLLRGEVLRGPIVGVESNRHVCSGGSTTGGASQEKGEIHASRGIGVGEVGVSGGWRLKEHRRRGERPKHRGRACVASNRTGRDLAKGRGST